MAECLVSGWGVGPWGTTPWGGGLLGSPGGPVPTEGLFDLFCVGPCGPMSFVLTYDEVDAYGDTTQFVILPDELDLQIGSGGPFLDYDARLSIVTAVPSSYTLEFTVRFDEVPSSFADIVNKHLFIGSSNSAGICVGLFFSQSGIGYTGPIKHTGGALHEQDLVLETVFQVLPASSLFVEAGVYWTYRVVVDGQTGTVYVFATRTADLASIGHQLRFLVPGIKAEDASTPPPDQTLISVRGTVGEPSIMSLDTVCLASQPIIPNAPPIADAGQDQAVRACSIIMLNGSASFDPEGSNLLYLWRLVGAPDNSIFTTVVSEAFTSAGVAGFTDKVYSVALSGVDAADPFMAGPDGDVVVIGGVPYTIRAKGTDGTGFYLDVGDPFLEENLSGLTIRVIRQRGILNRNKVSPTFYPDLPGFFTFDLTVNDGQLDSRPSSVLVNVIESPVPRGCVPDLSFMWNYLSDVWALVEDRDHIPVFWGALAQVMASELLALWQVDYSKSLRDIQRLFQRRWLHYDPELAEPLPDLVQIRACFGGVRHVFPLVGLAGLPGTTLILEIPFFQEDRVSSRVKTLTLSGAGTLTAADVRDQLLPQLLTFDPRFSITVSRSLSGLGEELRIDAPFYFAVQAASTAPLFSSDRPNTEGEGSGQVVGINMYRVDRPLSAEAVQAGDILVLYAGSTALVRRIVRVVTDAGDDWENQRVVVSESLPVGSFSSWKLVSRVSSQRLNFYTALGDQHDVLRFDVFADGVDRSVTSVGCFVEEGRPLVAGTVLGSAANFLAHPLPTQLQFDALIRLSHIPIDDLVVDIPRLQEKIKDPKEEEVLRRNLDFFLDSFRGVRAINFSFDGFGSSRDIWQDLSTVPARLWAEITYLDNRPTIEANFGLAAGMSLDNLAELPPNTDYLSVVRGLWFSYFRGASLRSLRSGVQILLGLPFAEEDGVIEEIREDFSPSQGRILIRDKSSSALVRSYTYPAALPLETNPSTGAPYAVGDSVAQFDPLVGGAEVVDWVKDPKWFQGFLQQGSFYEVEKYFRFMVRIDSPAFGLASLSFVQQFVRKIKPTYTLPMFVVAKDVGLTEINVVDDLSFKASLYIFDGVSTNGVLGQATMIDEGHLTGGGYRASLDQGVAPTPAPVFPNSQPVEWGLDRALVCPIEYIDILTCVAWPGAIPTLDSIFSIDQSVFLQDGLMTFNHSWLLNMPAAGTALYSPVTTTFTGVLTRLSVTVRGDADSPFAFSVIVSINGVDQAALPFTQTGGDLFDEAVVAYAVSSGDVLAVRVVPDSAANTPVYWKRVVVRLGVGTNWALDTALPADDYCAYRELG